LRAASGPVPAVPAVDVLILGAGLAGLRAALSCLEASPKLRVAVACPSSGPSGSSFSNQNNALGMHACLTDHDREEYVREVLALNPMKGGAWLSPELLAVQAEESEARLRDLEDLDLPFVREPAGELLAHSSCFSPHSRRAFVFTGLAAAHECFAKRLEALGCRFLHGHHALAVSGHPGCGALLVPVGGGEAAFIRAKAVVAAMGGPARLFTHSMAGPNPGFGQGVLAAAGARMANLGFLQYMWGTLPGKTFWQPAELGRGGWRITRPEIPSDPRATLEGLVPGLTALAVSRSGHCPYGYGLDDSTLDLTLAEGLDADGTVTLLAPDGTELRVAPMAHASNGGAIIDQYGQTSVPGLLACGECATGMHGANRVGGGMVLATQVFGHRAGLRAAWIAENSGNSAEPAPLEATVSDEAERREALAWLGGGLSRHAVLGGRPGHEHFAAEVRQRLEASRDRRLSLALETGLDILENLPARDKGPQY
jgi:L-aspartate oxidase